MVSTATMSSLKDQEFQMVGCLGKHASYTFYKSIRIGERTLSLSNFFPVRIWPDSAILSIAEVQLLWKDRNESLCSLRLYFLPENTPFGRFSFHGEDEVIALQDKVIIRASDLMTWMVEDGDWDWGFVTPSCEVDHTDNDALSKAFMSDRINKEDKLVQFFHQPRSNSVLVLTYERYVRLRSVLKRLEGSSQLSNWLNHPLVMAIGGLAVGPNCRLLFARDVFDCPELEDHELLCNHLAPKLKGRPRKKKRTRNPSMGSVSNESETSSNGSCGSADKTKLGKKPLNGLSAHPNQEIRIPALPLSKAARMMEEKGLEAIHKELIFGSSANGLQILKVDSSQMLKNGQLSSHSGAGGKRVQSHGGRRLGGATSSSVLDAMKHVSADMLGPGLSELAQKLKRSNALQILPIKPQLGRDAALDYEMFQFKRMKMDPDAELVPRFNSDMLINPLNSGPYVAKKHTIYAAPIIDKVISKTHDIVKEMVGSKHSSKSSTNQKISSNQKQAKQPVATSTIDATAKVKIPIPSCAGSPYRPNNQIYSNPAAERIQLAESFSRHGGKDSSASALDYSVRKRHHQESSRSSRGASATVSKPATRESDLLDLTIKPSGSGGRHQPIYGRPTADIPPPNVMDKLGLQLTSEVTLFPSPNYANKAKETSHSKSGHHRATSLGSTSNPMKAHDSVAGSSRKSLRSPSTSTVVQSLSAAAGMGSHKDVPMRHHHQNHYPNHLNAKPVFGGGPADRGMMPRHSPSQGHSSSAGSSGTSAITIKPMTNEEKHSAGKLKELEKAYAQAMPAPQFMPPTFVPKMDPAYLSLLANPFLMSPQALMSIPGAMEQFQMYKDLFQQSGIPQFPLGWPPQGPGNDRASK